MQENIHKGAISYTLSRDEAEKLNDAGVIYKPYTPVGSVTNQNNQKIVVTFNTEIEIGQLEKSSFVVAAEKAGVMID